MRTLSPQVQSKTKAIGFDHRRFDSARCDTRATDRISVITESGNEHVAFTHIVTTIELPVVVRFVNISLVRVIETVLPDILQPDDSDASINVVLGLQA